MSTMSRSIIIDVPVGTVFEFAKDLGTFWSCWPGVALRDVEIKPEGVGTSGRLYSHFLGIHMEGTVEYTEVVPNERIVAKVSAAGEHPIWVFSFEAVDGGTKLTAEAQWHVNVPAVGKPIEDMMAKGHEGEAEHWLAAVKHHLEGRAAA